MRRLLLVAVLLCAVVLTTSALARPGQVQPLPPLPVPGGPLPVPGGTPAPAPGSPGSPAPQHVLRVGDTMRVEGASLGCQVTRRAAQVVIECRRAGALAKTYGTFLSERTASVARFRSSRSAQVVFNATQNGGWRACGMRASASRQARAAAGACR